MRDDKIIHRVLQQLRDGSDSQRSSALDSIRDLASQADLRAAFGEAGATEPLLRLLGSDAELAAKAAWALRSLAEETSVRRQLIEAGGVAALLQPLRAEPEAAPALLAGVLQALQALAGEEAVQLELVRGEGLQAIVKVIASSDDTELLEAACQLTNRLGGSALGQNAAREQGALLQLLRLLGRPATPPRLAEAAVQALISLTLDNEVNQNHVREGKGMEAVVKLLDVRRSASLACAATTFLTVLCINNGANKDQVRELWAIPLLVSLLEQEAAGLQERAVECLRVLTTGSDLNKLALFSIPAGVRSLVRILRSHAPTEAVTERAAAIIGNLSTSEHFGASIRECGGLQPLVALLDSGDARVTEIAAKTLANMAGAEQNRQGIRLAGGRPPLIHLLTQRPSEQVLLAAEEALRRLQVSNEERNAMLETLRYCDQRDAARQAAAAAAASSSQQSVSQQANGLAGERPLQSLPFTQYGVEETCELLRALGIRETDRFAAEGVTGGDLLELSAEEMQHALGLSPLQAKKVQNLKKAFDTFDNINATPGKAEVSQFELREWLQRQGRSEEECQAVVAGFKRALRREELPFLSFSDFALHFQWLCKTLQVMSLADEVVLESRSLSLRSSLAG